MTDISVIQTLEGALASADPARREAVLAHVTDMFVGGCGHYSPVQVELFDQVFLKLSRDIELRARRRLAERLATAEHVPAATARELAHDPSAEVAAPILRNVLQLDDSDIIAVASNGSDDHPLRHFRPRPYRRGRDRCSGRSRQSRGCPRTCRQRQREIVGHQLRQAGRPRRCRSHARGCGRHPARYSAPSLHRPDPQCQRGPCASSSPPAEPDFARGSQRHCRRHRRPDRARGRDRLHRPGGRQGRSGTPDASRTFRRLRHRRRRARPQARPDRHGFVPARPCAARRRRAGRCPKTSRTC